MRGVLGQVLASLTVLIGLGMFVCGLALLFANALWKVHYGENISYVPEFFLFANGLYVTIAGARAGINYVQVKREEITAINNQTSALTARSTPPV